MSDLTSAAVPPIGPEDHVLGEGEKLLIVYADLGCPHCASAWAGLAARPGALAFRHFPVARKPPRSPSLHAAAEAAGARGRFFARDDSTDSDRGHVDDPHLWQRAEQMGLDLARFERDRRAPDLAARVGRDLPSGLRAGGAGT